MGRRVEANLRWAREAAGLGPVLPEIVEVAISQFQKHGGLLRTKDALRLGIHPRTLYELRDRSLVERVSRGFHRLASLPALARPDWVTVALRVPRATVCLVSALAYHGLTTRNPDEVHIALPCGTKSPSLAKPKLRVFRFSGAPLTEGIERVEIDGVVVSVYSAEKTVVDCFRFRNKIGLDVAIEGLRLCLRKRRAKVDELARYARVCRVENVMAPYVRALWGDSVGSREAPRRKGEKEGRRWTP